MLRVAKQRCLACGLCSRTASTGEEEPMNPDELETLLRITELHDIITAIDNPRLQAERGWDLGCWGYRSAPGSVCFLYWNPEGQPTEMLVAVRAPRGQRDRIAHLVADFPLPAKLVLLD
jgi:hypothetical protein